MAHSTPFPKAVSIPIELKWTPEAATKAAEKSSFIRVGGNKVSSRYLSGGPRSWTSANPLENRTIFNTEYRISGIPENVESALRYAGYSDEQIKEAIANSITRDNYSTTKATEYKQELALHIQNKESKPQTECYGWEQVLWFADNIKSAARESKKGEHKGSAPVQQRVATGSSLLARAENVKSKGKLLDVSNMDMVTHKDIIARDIPKTAKPGKAWSMPVPFMSNDITKYIAAIQLLYGDNGVTTYAKNIEEVRNILQGYQTGKTTVPTVLPQAVAKPKLTPPKVIAGAAVAPVPVFKPTGPAAVPKMRSPKVGTVGGAAFPLIPPMRG